MVFWATVLSFIIGIMSYMMYPRSDKHITEYMPASEAYVASFVAQHQAAKDYLREALVAIGKLSGFVPDVKSSSVYVISPELNDKGEVVGSEGILPFMPTIHAIMPTKEFKPVMDDKGKSGFASVLACFSHPERRLTDGSYFTSTLEDCTSANAQTKYVFTYGPLPEFDLSIMRKNILLWEAAILKRTHGSPDCGFLQKRGNRYFINNSSRLTRTIPSEFAKLLGESYLKTPDETQRVYVGSGDNSSPLLFCMTPANDPYPRTNLVLNLDSKINTGEPGIHNATVGKNATWKNLAPSSGDSPDSAEIFGGMGDWHIVSAECKKYKDCWELSDSGFAFGNDRYINTHIRQENLGSSVTFSMAMFLKNHSYTQEYSLFGSGNCAPTDDKPCLHATMRGSEIKITLKRSSSEKNSVLTGTLQVGIMSEIDYILNRDGHKLLINGKVASAENFATDKMVSQLAAGEFLIGWDGNVTTNKWQINTGVLYNFLIYKRATMADLGASYTQGEEANVRFDVQGLARVYNTNILRYDY